MSGNTINKNCELEKNALSSNKDRRTHDCNVLLQHAMKRIYEVKAMQKFKSTVVDRKLQMSYHLIDIEQKIQNSLYANVDEYLKDLKRMTFDDLLHDKQLLHKANQFYTACESDGNLIKGCAECYFNEVTTDTDEWMSETCSTPHLIVSTKYGHYKYFPAKVISFDEKTVLVRLFYEMEIFDVLYKDCVLYSNSGTKFASGIKYKAMKDANRYIENVIKKFGHYNYGDTTSPITAQNISLHLHNMTLPECTSAGSECILVNESSPSTSQTHPNKMPKRIKLENYELPNDDDGRDDVDDDMDSTMGNVGHRDMIWRLGNPYRP